MKFTWKSIDLGWLISHYILHGSPISDIGGLYYLTIIIMLCAKSEVVCDAFTDTVLPICVIDKSTLWSYKLTYDRAIDSSLTLTMVSYHKLIDPSVHNLTLM